MSKVPELDLQDEVLELTDVVENPSAGNSGDDAFDMGSSDLDMSFEQELEDLFSGSDVDDESATQAPPRAGASARDNAPSVDLEVEGDALDLSGFELETEGEDDILDLGAPLAATADLDISEDHDLAATTVLSSRDRDLDDLDDLGDFAIGDQEEDDDLAATTVMTGQNEGVADVGGFELEAEDELTLDLGEDDDNEDQADAFVADEDFDISGLDDLLGADEGAADDIGPMSSTADIEAAELGLDEMEFESTAVQGMAEPEPEAARPADDDLDVLGLEELISDLELPEEGGAEAEFNMSDFAVEDETALDLEDITEPAPGGEGDDLIDLGLEDIIEAGEPAPALANDEAVDFGEDLVDLSDTFDESLGGLGELGDVMGLGETGEQLPAADAGGEWDIEVPEAEEAAGTPEEEPGFELEAPEVELEFEEEAPAAEFTLEETPAEGGELSLEEETELGEFALEEPPADEFTLEEEIEAGEFLLEEEAPAAEEDFGFEAELPEEAAVAAEEFAFEEPASEQAVAEEAAIEEEVAAAPEPAPEPVAQPAFDQEAAEQLIATLEAMESRINALEDVAAEREGLMERISTLEGELDRISQSAGTLEHSLRDAMERLDENLGENGAVVALVTQQLDAFRESLGEMQPSRDEELANRVAGLEASLEQARAANAERLDTLEQKAGQLDALEQKVARLDELDALSEKISQAPTQDAVESAATQKAQSTVDEALQGAVADDGSIAAKIAEKIEQAVGNLKSELSGEMEAIRKTAEETAAAQPAEDALADSTRTTLREELDKELAENGSIAAALTAKIEQAVGTLKSELSGEMDAIRKTAEETAAAQPAEDALAETTRTTLREELDKELAENGSIAAALTAKIEQAVSNLKSELSDEMESIRKTAEETAAAQPAEDALAESTRTTLREELDKELAENGSIAAALTAKIEQAVSNLKSELSGEMEAIRKTAEETAAAQPAEGALAESTRTTLREELDKELAENGSIAAALTAKIEQAVSNLKSELSDEMESIRKTAEETAAAQPKESGVSEEAVRTALQDELGKALASGGAIASRIEERIGSMEESARLDNMALESRLSQVIERFGDPDTVPDPVINAISSGIVEAMDEGGPFHSRLEERLGEISKERQHELESLADKLDEALRRFREEGVSRSDMAAVVDERMAPAMEKALGTLQASIDQRVGAAATAEHERLDAHLEELAAKARPTAKELRTAASEILEEKLPGFRESVAADVEQRLGQMPIGEDASQAIADAVESRMRDSLSEDSDIYENLVGNLTGQLERVIREGVEQLERKTVSHEDWNVMAARLRQEMTATIEKEAAKSAARIIREEISNLLAEE
ncbi:hypothetical protein [Oceanidesulfovibrio marinus]|uniref:Uncharacterized protein n=1 Tax=Oceanidesulfovibrio marinus TaxID=370038 RepID=A0A6P1ZFG1_9BACT|nr:hypothetical protein [Oceanidesulfovibrio marinus]TVM32801.1 hypothetical protein DQK91_13915 [Oceanidesulfovibrio marinus]